jgi:hypothetical protein
MRRERLVRQLPSLIGISPRQVADDLPAVCSYRVQPLLHDRGSFCASAVSWPAASARARPQLASNPRLAFGQVAIDNCQLIAQLWKGRHFNLPPLHQLNCGERPG